MRPLSVKLSPGYPQDTQSHHSMNTSAQPIFSNGDDLRAVLRHPGLKMALREWLARKALVGTQVQASKA